MKAEQIRIAFSPEKGNQAGAALYAAAEKIGIQVGSRWFYPDYCETPGCRGTEYNRGEGCCYDCGENVKPVEWVLFVETDELTRLTEAAGVTIAPVSWSDTLVIGKMAEEGGQS